MSEANINTLGVLKDAMRRISSKCGWEDAGGCYGAVSSFALKAPASAYGALEYVLSAGKDEQVEKSHRRCDPQHTQDLIRLAVAIRLADEDMGKGLMTNPAYAFGNNYQIHAPTRS